MPIERSGKRRAFTLVEVLTVLAIIGVLSAILFPILARVREKGRQATCQSNLKQIGLVIQQYMQDHDGNYPSSFYFHTIGSGVGGGLTAAVKNPQILWCPTGLQPYPGTMSLSICGPDAEKYPYPAPTGVGECGSMDTNYGYNEALFTDSVLGAIGSKEVKFQNVESLILVNDVPYQEKGKSVYIAGCPTTILGHAFNGVEYATFHSGGANFLFADGHVKWMNPETASKVQCEAAAHIVSQQSN